VLSVRRVRADTNRPQLEPRMKNGAGKAKTVRGSGDARGAPPEVGGEAAAAHLAHGGSAAGAR